MTTTPMVRQYLSLKDAHQDFLLFFRLGDFYELFFDDAVVAAKALDITLTKRGKDEKAIPMCGIPFHAAESYIGRLLKQGHKVAICEQVETPEEAQKRGHKSIVKRDVVRILTPGTVIEDAFLPNSMHNNFCVALTADKDQASVAAVDLSTGDFFVETVAVHEVPDVLSRRNPSEIVFPDVLLQNAAIKSFLTPYQDRWAPQSPLKFKADTGKHRLCQFYGVKSVESMGHFSSLDYGAAGGALEYIHLTQKENLPQLKPLQKIQKNSFLQIDAASRMSLELEQSQQGHIKDGFLAMINKTKTAPGARMLAHVLRFPSVDKKIITQRHDQVACLLKTQTLYDTLHHRLHGLPDGERALRRVEAKRGGPRDLKVLQTILQQGLQYMNDVQDNNVLPKLEETLKADLQSLHNNLSQALKDDVGLLARDGGFIQDGYSKSLDHFRHFKAHSQKELVALQAQYAAATNISSLKIKYNQVIGYFIEVTDIHKNKVDDTFIHRQSLKNAHRYTTPALLQLQEQLLSADHQALQLELDHFEQLCELIQDHQKILMKTITMLAHVDMIYSFANLSKAQNYVRPQLLDSPHLNIQKGRHPTIEMRLSQNNETFVANDLCLDESHKMVLLTGPNMGGKSTYLRQNALIIILAQMGCFVPAESADIGLVDRIFSRVGAGDDLSRGRSTFMMEMMETSAILHQATNKSFVILDEVGRGTSTYDGVAIAQATLEALHNQNKCRTLFATHYHELTTLEETLHHLKCMTVQTKAWEGNIIFLHTIVTGISHESYGIHVAKLAGLPQAVIERAADILKALEHKKDHPIPVTEETAINKNSISDEILKKIDPNQLSPREALDILFTLKEKQDVPITE